MTKLATAGITPRLFDDVVERSQTMMPVGYLPGASYVLIAGIDMLCAAGGQLGAPEPTGWSRAASGFKKIAGDGQTVLWVQRCGQFWIVERSLRVDDCFTQDRALVFAFGPAPIWTRTWHSAMRLAEYCDPIPCAPVAGYWADVGNVRVAG